MAKRKRRRPARRKSRKTTRRKRGMGSTITVRKAGVGMLGTGAMGAAMPPLIGGGVTAAVALGIRYFVKGSDKTSQMLLKWSWLFGHLAGIAASASLLAVGGKKKGMAAATSSFTAATMVGLFGWGSDMLIAPGSDTGPKIVAALANGAAMASGDQSLEGIVFARPQQGMRAIVAENAPHGQLSGGLGSYGETVTLSGLNGINTRVFGTPGFSA